MDAFLLKQVVSELSATLPGALVSKVHHALMDGASSKFHFPASDAFARWSVDPALRPPNA